MTDLRETIKQTCAELRRQAEKARQREGDYDILITRAELLEKALKDTETAPQETQSAECTPGATQGALVVTDAMVEAGRAALLEHAVLSTETQVRLALTAALPLAKTEAEVRADERERLAIDEVSAGLLTLRAELDALRGVVEAVQDIDPNVIWESGHGGWPIAHGRNLNDALDALDALKAQQE